MRTERISQSFREFRLATTEILSKIERRLVYAESGKRLQILPVEEHLARRVRNIIKSVVKENDRDALDILRFKIDKMVKDVGAMRILDGMYIVGHPIDLGMIFRGGGDGRYTAIAALKGILFRSEEILRAAKFEVVDILDEIPGQRPGPVQFGIDKDTLRISQPISLPIEGSERVTLDAREALIKSGAEVLAAVTATNCDRRVVAVFEQMQALLLGEHNSIAIGTWNLLVQAVTDAANDELPPLVIALIEGQIAGVSMLVAQYADWQIFSENAMACAIDAPQVRELRETVREIERDLVARPELADSEVPASFRMLGQLLDDPASASQRALFSSVRAVENLFSAIFRSVCEFVTLASGHAISQGARVAADVAVVTLAMLAVGWATHASAVLAAIPEAVWIVTAARLLGPAIRELTRPKSE